MVDAPVGDYEAHVRLWTGMLQTLIGWSNAQVARWAAHFKADIADENSVFYNQPPEYYATYVLAPNYLCRRLGTEKYFNLTTEIQGVLYDVLRSAKAIEEIDWQPAKEKIDAILAEYGESLSRVAEENADRYRD